MKDYCARLRIEKDATTLVDERATELIQEFEDHYTEFMRPDVDKRLVFEAWAIQKMAGLHITIFQLKNELDDLRTLVARRMI